MSSTGVLIVGVSPRRSLDDGYRGFFDLMAAQFAAVIADAQSTESERRRLQSLADIDRAKTAFFSNVSHEFRTPLTLMLGPIQAAATHPETPPEVRRQLELAGRNSLRLLKLVNSLLDFSRIEAGRVQASYQPTDAAALTEDLASTFRSAIESAGLAFIVKCDSFEQAAYLDREMWEKIVLNLLSNAFKFTLSGEISVHLRRENDQLLLEVADTGVGIPQEEIPRLFERFYRVEGTEGRTQEGSGIGLALVQELVMLHGGRIEAASRLGQGSRFRIYIPMGSAHLPADRVKAPQGPVVSTATAARAYVAEALRWLPDSRSEESAKPLVIDEGSALLQEPAFASSSGARIVLADDNADMRGYVRELLAPFYSVEAVADGESALAAVFRERPDLIVSDVMMPRLDGFGLLKALRSDESLRDIPVILLSARAGEESRIEGLTTGADDYLAKPFSARELIARVGALLELARVRREATSALRTSEERLRLALDAASMGTFMWDVDEDKGELDKRMLALLGQPDAETLDIKDALSTLIDRADEGRFSEALIRATDPHGDGALREDIRIKLPDGTRRWLSITGQVHFEGDPHAANRMAGVAIDITARKHVEHALRQRTLQYEALVDGAPLGVYLVDADFRIRQVNPIARPIFGDIPDLIGRGFDEVVHLLWPADSADELVRLFRRTLETGDPCETPERAEQRTNSGVIEYYEWQIHRIPLPDGRYGVVCYFRDISAHVHARNRLEAADRHKNEFLAMLAHELRNPLAPIRNAGELLSRSLAGDPRTRKITQMLQRQVKVMVRLVDDLLDVSRITQGRIVLKHRPVSLAEIVAQAVETVEPLIQDRGHKISVVSYRPLRVSGDSTRLVQCVVNVLTNAAKYTQPGGQIRVESAEEHGCAVLRIADNGPGIASDLLPHVFDLFVQSERTLDRAQGGLGIGLSLVKRLIEMHEGSVAAQSPGLGRGSTFEIRLPLSKQNVEQVQAEKIATVPSRILVVDDNADAADSLGSLLNLEGHEVEVTYGSREALTRARTYKPDVVLLDIGLPDMDGFEVAREMRASPELRNIRLIALTGYGQAEDRQRAKSAGFDDHLVKPVEFPALQRALAGLAQRQL